MTNSEAVSSPAAEVPPSSTATELTVIDAGALPEVQRQLSDEEVVELLEAAITSEGFAVPKSSFRTLLQQAMQLDALLSKNGGELTPELEQVADRLSALMISKVDGVVDYLVSLDADGETLAKEIKRLQGVKKSYEARNERFAAQIMRSMLLREERRMDGQHRQLTVRDNPPKLVIVDPKLIPERYKRTVTPPPVQPEPYEEIDEDAIKRDLVLNEKIAEQNAKAAEKAAKKGLTAVLTVIHDIPGAKLTRETRLQYK